MHACMTPEHSANAVNEEARRATSLPQAQAFLRHRQDALTQERQQALRGFWAEALQRVGGDLAYPKNTRLCLIGCFKALEGSARMQPIMHGAHRSACGLSSRTTFRDAEKSCDHFLGRRPCDLPKVICQADSPISYLIHAQQLTAAPGAS